MGLESPHISSFDANNLIIESGASFITNVYAGQHMSYNLFITVYGDFINSVCKKTFKYHEGNKL